MKNDKMHHFLTLRRQTKIGRKKIYRDSLFYFNEYSYTVLERYEFYNNKKQRISNLFLEDRQLDVPTLIMGMSIHITTPLVIYRNAQFIKYLCDEYILEN
jgi:hypothetical protein